MSKIKYIRNPEVFMLEQGECEQLKALDLAACELEAIPNKIKDFKNIRDINISNNLLSDLPFNNMPTEKLLKLTATNNRLKNLSSGISRLKKLRFLYLGKNMLEEFPVEITELPNLRKLFFHDNFITRLPSEIGNLKQLRVLVLCDNKPLVELPEEIVKLNKLQVLDLRDTKISKLPEGLSELTGLKTLKLSSRYFEPSELEEIKSWFPEGVVTVDQYVQLDKLPNHSQKFLDALDDDDEFKVTMQRLLDWSSEPSKKGYSRDL
ncbi:leucine-rich repeat domain-containing protein [Neptuniibacter marinus]|uniref:leucine-rich repeat domain-containing protein n=1 Tax=Neptuniibacter marinus TaxID=1806670 RepID=UPI003B58E6D3